MKIPSLSSPSSHPSPPGGEGKGEGFPLNLLFKRFFKLGATAYGGPAMSGQIKQAVVTDYGWIIYRDAWPGTL